MPDPEDKCYSTEARPTKSQPPITIQVDDPTFMLAFGGIPPHVVQHHADEMNASLRVPEVFAARVRIALLYRGACARKKCTASLPIGLLNGP
jgi:hypothetical protein